MQVIPCYLNVMGKKGYETLFEGRKAEALMGRLGKRFHITNYEVTYGKNGWHPHHHILVFSDKELSNFRIFSS